MCIRDRYKSFSKSFDSVNSSWRGVGLQVDAASQFISKNKIISTDPPYYDNIGYADLSDFFYCWLRRSMKTIFPSIFSTLAVPKEEELIAAPYRHGSKESAEQFFLEGMTRVARNLFDQIHPCFPISIYYAFKQSESDAKLDTHSTGWEIFLEAILRSGFIIVGTWPIRTENSSRLRGQVSNALASSIVLVCQRRDKEAATINRREFIRELQVVLPKALDEMTKGGVNSPVAPVDLSQAIIGPGMAVFSKYATVLEADGKPMTVKTALQLINRFFAEDDFDHDTQFCLHWFENYGWSEGKFGDADVLARAKGTSVGGVADAGVLEAGQGFVRLLKFREYPVDWSPEVDQRAPVWEALHHLIRVLQSGGGESEAGALLARVQAKTTVRMEGVRALTYRLHTLCERKGWAEDARFYNELANSLKQIEAEASSASSGADSEPVQGVLLTE